MCMHSSIVIIGFRSIGVTSFFVKKIRDPLNFKYFSFSEK